MTGPHVELINEDYSLHNEKRACRNQGTCGDKDEKRKMATTRKTGEMQRPPYSDTQDI